MDLLLNCQIDSSEFPPPTAQVPEGQRTITLGATAAKPERSGGLDVRLPPIVIAAPD